jgi:hypothetical protein
MKKEIINGIPCMTSDGDTSSWYKSDRKKHDPLKPAKVETGYNKSIKTKVAWAAFLGELEIRNNEA